MMIEKIPIKAINMFRQKPTKVKEYYIELHDNSIRYVTIFRALEPENMEEPELGEWKESITNFKGFVLKRNIVGCERVFAEISDCWGVYIFVMDSMSDIKMFFETEKEANDLLDKIENWLLT